MGSPSMWRVPGAEPRQHRISTGLAYRITPVPCPSGRVDRALVAAGDSLLAALFDGHFRRLRDDNHVDPHRILVWDRLREPVIQALPFLELLGVTPAAMPRKPSGAVPGAAPLSPGPRQALKPWLTHPAGVRTACGVRDSPPCSSRALFHRAPVPGRRGWRGSPAPLRPAAPPSDWSPDAG